MENFKLSIGSSTYAFKNLIVDHNVKPKLHPHFILFQLQPPKGKKLGASDKSYFMAWMKNGSHR